jgi:hypothetical protein
MAPKARSAKRRSNTRRALPGDGFEKRATKTKATSKGPALTASALPHLRPRPRRIAQEHMPMRR